VVQNACKPALSYLQLPRATSCPTLPVVSEWYQKARCYQALLGLRDRGFTGSRIRTSENAPSRHLGE
jgi:hypothetical protein